MMADYDPLADIYDAWAAADPASGPTLRFYADLYVAAQGIVVELGIGNGRIALEAVARGCRVIGVDISPRMIENCRRRAIERRLADRLNLVIQDMRELDLPHQATLITCPFRSLGHIVNAAERQQFFTRVLRHLAPGGRFVFDHYIWNEEWARTHDRVPQLMLHERSEQGGRMVWDVYRYQFEAQRMSCSVLIQTLAVDGRLVESSAHSFEFSWFSPSEIAKLAADTGFECEAVYGDFVGNPLTEQSTEQVWFLRRPEAR